MRKVVIRRPYQLEELILLFRMEVETGEGEKNAAQVGQGDVLGPAQEVLGHQSDKVSGALTAAAPLGSPDYSPTR